MKRRIRNNLSHRPDLTLDSDQVTGRPLKQYLDTNEDRDYQVGREPTDYSLFLAVREQDIDLCEERLEV